MSLQPLAFTGVSSLSDSLRQVLTRAVSIASIPLQQLQSADAGILQKKTLLSGLGDAAAALGSSLTSLADIAGNRALNATSSNAETVTVVNSGAASAATYTISEIQSLATFASETSTSGYADANATPVSSTNSLELTFGAQTRTIALTDNTLAELRDKINGLGLGVAATIFTTGNGNYLSVSANARGATTLTLKEGAVDFLSAGNQGSNARFKLNNVPVDRTSNVVNDVVSGISFTLAGTTLDSNNVDTGEKISLSLATDRSRISSGIGQLVAKYNALLETVNGQVGPNAGLLTGDSSVRDAQQSMRAIAGYSASGVIKSLAEMGVTFDSAGKMSFDAAAFDSLSDSQVSGALSFFGSPTTGFGLLAKQFSAMTDPVTGSIRLEQDGFDRTDKNLQSQIATLEERINDMQNATARRLQAADALLAQLESQQQILNASIQSANLAIYGKNKE